MFIIIIKYTKKYYKPILIFLIKKQFLKNQQVEIYYFEGLEKNMQTLIN